MIPRWVDRTDYPFLVHTFDTMEGRLAFLDEGKGRPLLFVHGNPSWSYQYRQLISNLSRDHRCLALDHLGFGLSDKEPKADYSPEAHSLRLSNFIEHCELDRVTIVAHDFGGPIAMDWAVRNPERVESLILFNTWMWPLNKNAEAQFLYKVFDNPINRIYYSILRGSSAKFFLPVLMPDAQDILKHVLEHYMFPFDWPTRRDGPYTLARALVRSTRWLDSLWSRRERLAGIPMLLLWSEGEELSGLEGLHRLTEAFPLARAVRLEGGGNFELRGAARRSLVEMRGFMRTIGGPMPRLSDDLG